MPLIAALVVEKELEDARERRANPSTTDAGSDKFGKVHPEVYEGQRWNMSANFIMVVGPLAVASLLY